MARWASGAHCCMTTSQKQDNMREQEHTSREPNSLTQRIHTWLHARLVPGRSLALGHFSRIHSPGSSFLPGAWRSSNTWCEPALFPFRLRIRRPHRKSHTPVKIAAPRLDLQKIEEQILQLLRRKWKRNHIENISLYVTWDVRSLTVLKYWSLNMPGICERNSLTSYNWNYINVD